MRQLTIADEGGTHLSIKADAEHSKRYPKNTLVMERNADKFVLENAKGNNVIKFDENEVIVPVHAEVLAAGSVDLTGGASGSVDGITINGVEIMSGVENFDTTLDQTAINVAANITANTSIPNYTATATGSQVDIVAVAGSGNTPNAFVVVSSATTITTTDVDMSGGENEADVLESALAAIIYE